MLEAIVELAEEFVAQVTHRWTVAVADLPPVPVVVARGWIVG